MCINKRMLSLLLCVIMVLQYIPAPAMAEEATQTGLCAHHQVHENCGYVAAAKGKECTFVCEACAVDKTSDTAVAEVKSLMDALPELDAVKAMSVEEKKAAYTQTQAAYDAYGKLTEEQKAQLPNPEEVFKPLFDYFNTLIDADGEIGSGTPDSKPPVLNGLTISATEVPVLGTLEVIVDASDDVSGVSTVWVEFYCEDTQKGIHGSLSGTYYDEETHEWVPYEDEKFHGTLTVGQYAETGVFKLSSVSLYDKADNSQYYYDDILPDSLKNIQFTVVESTTPDGMPPVLNGLEISTTTVTAPGTLEVIVDASDDVSGVSTVWVEFYCEDTQKGIHSSLSGTYYDEETHEWVPYEDEKFHGTLAVGQYVETGVFKLSSVSLYDKASNSQYYYDDILPDSLKNIQFTVVESTTPDGMPPVLNDLEISTTTVTAPGTLKVIVDASDDVSGVSTVWVEFYCEDTQKGIHGSLSGTYYDEETHEWVPYEDEKFHGTLTVGQYVETGVFKLSSVSLYDKASNSQYYYDDILPDSLKNIQFTVTNVGADITTSTNQSTFVEEVKNAANDAYIAADYSGNATMPQEVFDAIAGTDKTIDLISEGITWRFEGSDITNTTKPIDLSVQITKAEENTSSSGQAIQDKLNGTTGVVMKFAENGTLPGKATIQVKVDYAMREYLGSDKGLCVYYYNNQTGELEVVEENLTVINDTYVEFSITHCSYYVLATSVADAEEILKGSCGANLTWTLSKKTGVLTISGTGPMTDYTWNNQPVWRQGKNSRLVTSVVVCDGVTSIGSCAFQNLNNVKAFSLPEGITTIGDSAFAGCSLLTELILPNSVVTIGNEAFYHLRRMTSLHIPEKITSIGERNFLDCSSLSSITVAANNPSYSSVNGVLYDKAANRLICCPDGYAQTLVIPASVTTPIDFGMFNNCISLKNVEAESGSTLYSSVGGVLYDHSVKELIFCPAAYEGTLVIPVTVQSIGTYAWGYTSKLKAISVDPQSPYYSSHNGVLYNKSGTELLFCPKGFTGELQIPDGTTHVAKQAIQDCHGITGIIFPKTISGFGNWAITQCNKLKRLVFSGSAPTFEDSSLGNLNASVYYPAGDSSWSAVVGKNYNGQITWVPLSDAGICGDNLTWIYESTGGTLTITGSGDMYNYSPETTPWKDYFISQVIFSGNITRIGDYAFSGCTGLMQMDIPNTVKRLGTAFYCCPDLEQIRIPDSLTKIDAAPTYMCGSLKTILVNEGNPNYCSDSYGVLFNKNKTVLIQAPIATTRQYVVPGSVTKISDMAFSGCYHMSNIWLPASLTEIGADAFSGCYYLRNVAIPETVRRIGNTAFSSCRYLNEMIFAGNAPEIGFNCFYGSKATVSYPAHKDGWTSSVMQSYGGDLTWKPVGTTGTYGDAFQWSFDEATGTLTISGEGILCANSIHSLSWSSYGDQIKSVVLEDGVTVLGENMFITAPNMTQISLPETVIAISYDAFSNCTSLQKVVIPDSVESIRERAFENCTSLTEVNIPDSVRTIREDTFRNCSSLAEVTLPEGVTEVVYSAFENCSSLATVTLPADLTGIHDDAFKNCSNLKTVVLPENLQELGTQALSPFPNVTAISFVGDAPIFAADAFLGITATAYYPANKTNWNKDIFQNYGGNITWLPNSCVGEHAPTPMEPVAPTCGSPGHKGGSICSVCGKILENPQEVPATGKHSYEGVPAFLWSVQGRCTAIISCSGCSQEQNLACTVSTQIIPATKTQGGSITYTASILFNGKTYTDINVITVAPGDHTMDGMWYSDQTHHWRRCISCAATFDRTEHIAGHAATQNTAQKCTICDHVLQLPLGLDWIMGSNSWASGYYAKIMEQYGDHLNNTSQ